MSEQILAPSPELIERFWSKVNKDGPIPSACPQLGRCWLWTGTLLKPWPYGQISVANKRMLAHRLSWLIHAGLEPTGQVNHKCDNHSCVRPSHLYEGTQADNMRDAASRARFHSNGNHCRAKITADDVREIRARREAGERLQFIADIFGITKQNVALICKRQAWSHIS